MISEWQPIMPDDELKFKARTVFQFLRSDGSKFLVVGQGNDKIVPGAKLTSDDVVAWREFDCAADARLENPPQKSSK